MIFREIKFCNNPILARSPESTSSKKSDNSPVRFVVQFRNHPYLRAYSETPTSRQSSTLQSQVVFIAGNQLKKSRIYSTLKVTESLGAGATTGCKHENGVCWSFLSCVFPLLFRRVAPRKTRLSSTRFTLLGFTEYKCPTVLPVVLRVR